MRLIITIRTPDGRVDPKHREYGILEGYARAQGFEFEAKDDFLVTLEDDNGEDE